jgi:uncharacterized repeat protein (TIGR03803 family)
MIKFASFWMNTLAKSGETVSAQKKPSMKTCNPKNLFLPYVLLVGLGCVFAVQLTAQTFTTLYNFTPTVLVGNEQVGYWTNSSGAHPTAGLVLSGNSLYGTARGGGIRGNGTVFKVNSNGMRFMTLYTFTGGSDGANPEGGLILSGDKLYGTSTGDASDNAGTVFSVNSDGTGFTNLHSFTVVPNVNGTNSDGYNPIAGLVLSGGTLYGTAPYGGISGSGTIFKVNTDGTGFMVLHSFTEGSGPFFFLMTNSDGAYPQGGLILSGNTLYGTAYYGGSSGFGTVFALNTDGTDFTNLHTFAAAPYYTNQSGGVFWTNSDGSNPVGSLTLLSNTLYGMTLSGGSSGKGTAFKLNTDGMGFAVLHSFTATTSTGPPNYFGTNSDGALPTAGLVLMRDTLFGTTSDGGSSGYGTVFSVKTDGAGFTNLHTFTATPAYPGPYTNSDGYGPNGLLLSGNTLYGTAAQGGSGSSGTVFSISFPPQLTLVPSGANSILTWPINYAGFDYTGYTLQSTTNLGSSPIWTSVSSSPVVIGGQKVVVNPMSGTQQFFRLSQ